jgi:hypothetical protein
METLENTTKLLKFVSQKYEKGEIDDDSLVSLMILCDSYLQLKTAVELSEETGKTRSGIVRHTKLRKTNLLRKTYYIDNN